MDGADSMGGEVVSKPADGGAVEDKTGRSISNEVVDDSLDEEEDSSVAYLDNKMQPIRSPGVSSPMLPEPWNWNMYLFPLWVNGRGCAVSHSFSYQVFVANHTSMIDFVILERMTAFAVAGWIGFLQTTVLESLGCIWFNWTETNDRHAVAKKQQNFAEAVIRQLQSRTQGQ